MQRPLPSEHALETHHHFAVAKLTTNSTKTLSPLDRTRLAVSPCYHFLPFALYLMHRQKGGVSHRTLVSA